jgi:hypothetical protein
VIDRQAHNNTPDSRYRSLCTSQMSRTSSDYQGRDSLCVDGSRLTWRLDKNDDEEKKLTTFLPRVETLSSNALKNNTDYYTSKRMSNLQSAQKRLAELVQKYPPINQPQKRSESFESTLSSRENSLSQTEFNRTPWNSTNNLTANKPVKFCYSTLWGVYSAHSDSLRRNKKIVIVDNFKSRSDAIWNRKQSRNSGGERHLAAARPTFNRSNTMYESAYHTDMKVKILPTLQVLETNPMMRRMYVAEMQRRSHFAKFTSSVSAGVGGRTVTQMPTMNVAARYNLKKSAPVMNRREKVAFSYEQSLKRIDSFLFDD